MGNEPMRIAMIMGKMVGGGVESVIMNYYKYIDHSQVQFDFIIDKDSTIVPEKEIAELGGHIYQVAPYQQLREYDRDLTKLFQRNNYTIVHSQLNTLSIFPLRIAKKCGIPIRIAHNHSTGAPKEWRKNLIKDALRPLSTIYPTHYMSPTFDTGKWLFGKKRSEQNLIVLKDAIDIKKFEYNTAQRISMRKKLGISSENFVIGNIGRMVWQKNQKYVLTLFNKIIQRIPEAKLLIVGEGPLKTDLLNLAKDLDLANKIVFVPYIEKPENIYQAMDCFLFPSYYEGLGMVCIEAQAAGLHVICSDNVPNEVQLSNKCTFISLKDTDEIWIKKILDIKSSKMFLDRSQPYDELINSGYDIDTAGSKLLNIYNEMINTIK